MAAKKKPEVDEQMLAHDLGVQEHPLRGYLERHGVEERGELLQPCRIESLRSLALDGTGSLRGHEVGPHRRREGS